MKRFKIILTFALILTLLAAVALPGLNTAKALDFGDFSGDSDFGGSDWGSSSSDWGSSSSDWGSSSSHYSSGGGSGGSDFVIVLIVVIIVIIIIGSKKNSSSQNKSVAPGATRTDASKLRPISEYLALDAHFDEAAFREKLGNRYVQMQNAWQSKDISSVRPFFTDAYYAQMERQLQRYKTQGLTNYIDRIAVLGVNVRGFYSTEGSDHIIAELSTRIVDYTLNDQTGELVSGDQHREKFLVYEWELVRRSGTVTGVSDGMTVENCPNCGAPISINATAKCPYCDSVIIVEANDWAICSIKGISQRTGS